MALSREEKEKIVSLYLEQKLKTKTGKKMMKQFGGNKEAFKRFFMTNCDILEQILSPAKD